ncbi:MAG TPA: HAD hydrolase-like protein [bacterium]|nr:HAD hydrolase-like protein [bacterium]
MRLVLFDIDGTLLMTGGAGIAALTAVFREIHGIVGNFEQVPVHGQTDLAIIHGIARSWLGRELASPEIDALILRYLPLLEERLKDSPGFRVLPGVAPLLDALAMQNDVTLGLATGNLEPAAYAKLRRAELDRFFGFGGFGSDSRDRAELTRIGLARGRQIAGEHAEAIVVGDTIHDVRSAQAAGAHCLAVATGITSQADLAAEGARWTVPSLDDPRVFSILGLDSIGKVEGCVDLSRKPVVKS